MNRSLLFIGSLVTGLVLTACQSLQAQDAPSILRHYRFLPRLSVLNETGGIYPRDINYRVMGTFDMATHPGVGESPLGRTATFENVDAWAAHPILDYVLDLDVTLNLSGLKGVQLPVMAPFDVYRFTGETQDGSAVNLYASVLGPWLRIRGETTPPPNGADMLKYKIAALARSRPYADFNDDGHINRDDLLTLTSSLGKGGSLGSAFSLGDANGDQTVDGADLLVWQRQYGEASPDPAMLDAAIDLAVAAAAGASLAAVPEPAGLTVALAALAFLAARRRR